MRGRSRRRAARIDFESLVAPEEVATLDSGSEYEGDDAAQMDVDAGGEEDLDLDLGLEMDGDGPSEPDTAADSVHNSDDSISDKDVKVMPKVRRKVASAPQRTTTPQQSASRIENLRDRLMLFYGDANTELVRAINLRFKWSDSLFTVSQSQLEPPVTVNFDLASSMESTLTLIDTEFRSSGSAIEVDGVILEPAAQRQTETAAVLNAGRGVLALDWDTSGSLLALGLRTDTDDTMNASTVQPELAPKYEVREGPTLLHVYKVEGSKVTPYASIEGSYGAVLRMSWSPNKAIALLFANGSVGIVNVSRPGSYRLKLNALPSGSDAKATCVCWRGGSLVVGYADGLVAEFDPADVSVPSYVVQLHDSVVSSVASGWPNLTRFIFTSGVDGNLKVTDTQDLRIVRKAPRLKHMASVAAYLPMADSFISLEDANTAKLVPVRHPSVQLTLTSVSRHNAGVTALATSLSHPLLLTGGQDGSLHITNPLRRTMATRRKRDLHLDCTVWRLECSHKTSVYRFVELLTVDTLSTKREGLNNMPLYPASVAVTSIAWVPGSTWYAAGTASGLVRIENVDG